MIKQENNISHLGDDPSMVLDIVKLFINLNVPFPEQLILLNIFMQKSENWHEELKSILLYLCRK